MPESTRFELDFDSEAYSRRPEFNGHLAWRVFQQLAGTLQKEVIVDYAMGRKAMKAGVLLSLALGMAKRLRRECPEKRIGIVLPPGIGGVIANLAVTLAGKIPVNLNFTLGRRALEVCKEKAGIRTLITAKSVQEKVNERCPDFPWGESILDIRDVLQSMPKVQIVGRLLCFRLFPKKLLARWWKIPCVGGDEEAALLFTSGSDGEPKGVVLSHRNILGNCSQVMDCGVLIPGEGVMANLPIFHSFGFTVTLWCTLIGGYKTVYVPSPLDYKKTAEAIAAEKCGVFLGTPTFLRPYLKRVDPEQLRSLKVVVAGAEKTPEGFHEAWEARFPNCAYLEGYGLTETTPVVAVNLPGEVRTAKGEMKYGCRRGSVGRLFNGMAVRVLDPVTRERQPLHERGILAFKGVNIFRGYLGEPEKTQQVLDGDWLITGDLGRVDDDGFLYIEGRLSRFSKIGGEMVPHGTVETEIAKVLGVFDSDIPKIAVTSRSDESKGEALVLLSTLDLSPDELKNKLAEVDLPNLWIPREIIKVEAIPTLASGKLDLKGLKAVADQK